MSKVSKNLLYIKQQKMFYKEQNEKVGDFIKKGIEIKKELGIDALNKYLVNHFVDLELNTFFSKLSLENQQRYSTQLLTHYQIAYGIDFVISVGKNVKIILDAEKEKILLNEEIIKITNNKTDIKQPIKPKGLRV